VEAAPVIGLLQSGSPNLPSGKPVVVIVQFAGFLLALLISQFSARCSSSFWGRRPPNSLMQPKRPGETVNLIGVLCQALHLEFVSGEVLRPAQHEVDVFMERSGPDIV